MTRGISSARVLFVLDSLHVGGTEMFATRAAELLTQSGADVHVALLRNEGALIPRMRLASSVHSLQASAGRLRALRLGRALRALVTHLDPDYVYAHDIFSNYIAAGAMLGTRGKPRLVTSWRWTTVDSRLRLTLAALAARRSDAIVTNARALVTAITKLGVAPSRVFWVPNLMERDAFVSSTMAERAEWRAGLSIPSNRLVVMCAGRLQHLKGQDLAIEAWAALAPATRARAVLVFAGDGELAPQLHETVRLRGLGDGVRFLGAYRTPPNIFRFADLVLLPSRSEGMPNTLLEAAAVGVPGVATKVGGVEELAVATDGGYLTCEPGDPEEMAVALERAIGDADWRAESGAAVSAYVRAQHDGPAVLQAIERALVPPRLS
jgi:glycosyltransferase involved in cell wall biosynthesis